MLSPLQSPDSAAGGADGNGPAEEPLAGAGAAFLVSPEPRDDVGGLAAGTPGGGTGLLMGLVVPSLGRGLPRLLLEARGVLLNTLTREGGGGCPSGNLDALFVPAAGRADAGSDDTVASGFAAGGTACLLCSLSLLLLDEGLPRGDALALTRPAPSSAGGGAVTCRVAGTPRSGLRLPRCCGSASSSSSSLDERMRLRLVLSFLLAGGPLGCCDGPDPPPGPAVCSDAPA